MRRFFLSLILLMGSVSAFAIDPRTLGIVERFNQLSQEPSPDANPLVSFVVQGDQVYMQERKFNPDTGAEVNPLLTVINPDEVAKLQNDINAVNDALSQVATLTTEAASTIVPSPPVIIKSSGT